MTQQLTGAFTVTAIPATGAASAAAFCAYASSNVTALTGAVVGQGFGWD